MKSNRAVALATLPLLALALVGCGDDSDNDTSSGDDHNSTSTDGSTTPDATDTDTDTDDAAPESSDSAPVDGSTVDIAAFRAQVDAGSEKVTTVHVEATNEGSFTGSSTGDFDYTAQPVSYHLTANFSDSPIEIIAIGADSWTKLGEQWAHSARADIDDDSSDPYAQIDEVLDDAESVTFVGEQDHDGSAAHVYEVAVELDEASDDEVPDLPESMTLQLWLDSEDRVVKMTGAFAIDGEETTSETVLSAFGEPVTIEAPAAADVM
jgi:hypothetical protein